MKTSSLFGIAAGAALLTATPLSLHWSATPMPTVSLDAANARVGRPHTPMSVAGVHRRAYRRGYGGWGPGVGIGVGAAALAAGAAAAASPYYSGYSSPYYGNSGYGYPYAGSYGYANSYPNYGYGGSYAYYGAPNYYRPNFHPFAWRNW